MKRVEPALPEAPEHGRVWEATVRGGGASVASLVMRYLLRLGSMVILARLLVPEDFGIVAMAGVILNLFVRIADLGLTTASTQREKVGFEDLSTLFWINVVGGVVLAAIMAASAPLAQAIFHEPRVGRVVFALSVILVAMGLGAQHEALLRRRLNYGLLAYVDPVSQGLGIAAGVIGAFLGMGYWSIVIMLVVMRFTTSALYWLAARWVPGKPGRGRNIRPLLRLGGSVVGAQSLIYITHNLDSILVGAVSGAADLGLYRRGYNALVLSVNMFIALMNRIVPSSLSRLQASYNDFARLYSRAVIAVAFIGCPAIGLAVGEAHAIISLILGDHWLGTVPLLRWLAPAGLAGIIEVSFVWLLISLGDGKRLLMVRVIRVVSVSIGLTIGLRWGTIGIAAGYGIATLVSTIPELVYASRGRSQLLLEVLGSLWRTIVSAFLAAVVVFLIRLEISIWTLALEIGIYGLFYLGIHMILPGGLDFVKGGYRVVRSLILKSFG